MGLRLWHGMDPSDVMSMLEEDHAHPRERIWLAALRLFAAHGYAGTGVQQIVDDAGVTKPTLYYHFGSKAELYDQLVQSAFTQRREAMEQAIAGHEDIESQLVAVGEAMVDFARQHKELMRICYATTFAARGELPPGIDTYTPGQRNFLIVQGLIEQAVERGELSTGFDPGEMGMAIYSQYFILSIIQVIYPQHAREGTVMRLVRMFLQGAGPSSNGRITKSKLASGVEAKN